MNTTIKNRVIMGVSLLLMTFSFASNGVAEESCTQVPTCEELGYTKTSCPYRKALKCPFDQSKLFCGVEKKCPAGYIYYSDNTCSEYYDNRKRVIGVVVERGLIVDIADVPYLMHWSDAMSECENTDKGDKMAHLPTAEEAQKIHNNVGAINAGLAKISGAEELSDALHWTSSENIYFDTQAQEYRFLSGQGYQANKVDSHPVRCVFDF